MVKKLGTKKTRSNRLTIRQRKKQMKKAVLNNAAARKAAKIAKLGGGARLSKDPGIPNLWPFKEKLLRKAERERQRADAAAEQQKKQKAVERAKRKKDIARTGRVDEMAALAAERARIYEARQAKAAKIAAAAKWTGGNQRNRDAASARKTRRQYFTMLQALVKKADIVIEVLDARDPAGCRAPHVESAILGSDPNKKIVLLLNKIDLVPQHVTEKWLAHLRHEYPAVAFKASTQQQAQRLSRVRGDAEIAKAAVLQGSAAVGTDALLNLLKNYCRSKGMKTNVTVGIIGYPNVGKSSVINSLKRSKAAGVSSIAGHTKTLQEVTIDKNITLLDCPGIIFDETGGGDDDDDDDDDDGGLSDDDDITGGGGGGAKATKSSAAGNAKEALLLRNCLTVMEIEDPVAAVDAILRRVPAKSLLEVYEIGVFRNVQEFLQRIAAKKGKMRRGGTYNYEEAARSVLTDWNQGKIPFYTLPPARRAGAAAAGGLQIAKDGWAAEFDLSLIADAQTATLEAASREDSEDFVAIPAARR